MNSMWHQPLTAANQQKRQRDDEEVASKKFRSAPQSGPFGAQPVQFQQFQQFQQQFERLPVSAPYQQPASMEMQIEAPQQQPVVQCDTRRCPPCFAHRFCRPGLNCMVAPPDSNSMQM